MRYVVENFLPGATQAAARTTMEALRSTSQRLSEAGWQITYLGGTYVVADEAMACRFEGTAHAVRLVYDEVGVTVDRLLESMDVESAPAPSARVNHVTRASDISEGGAGP